jgi:sRNA-binding regulator protein Hfq
MGKYTVLTIPKDRQKVTLYLDRGVFLQGEIFLDMFAGDLSIHQKVSAFFESAAQFFPIQLTDTGDTEFIYKNNVGRVEVKVPVEQDTEYFSIRLMHKIPVTAMLLHGDEISGDLMAEVPEEKNRLSDCLNLPQRFIGMRDGALIHYINKSALRKVIHNIKIGGELQLTDEP